MNKFRQGDSVVVISGKDKGKTGKIIKVFPDKCKVIVEKINIVKRHTKQTQNTPAGIVEKPLPLDWSKVMLVCPQTNKPTRVGFNTEKGKKVRVAKVSGELIKN